MRLTKLPLLVLLAALTTGQGWAAPAISGASGQILNNQTLIISGSGFGSKSQVAPLIWDNMENGNFSTAWGSIHNLSITSANPRHPLSQRSGTLNFTSDAMDGNFTAGNAVHAKWYAQYWFRLDPNWDWGTSDYSGGNRFLSNIKIFRMWNPGDNPENFVVAINGWENNIEYVMENVGNDPRNTFFDDMRTGMSRGVWHLFQFEYSENSGVGASNGQFRCWFDGKLMVERTDIMTRESSSDLKRPFIVGFSNVWESGGEGDDLPNTFNIDDVYVDNTWARVELGNRPSYGDCTVREIQPVTSWVDSSLQIRMNSGSFKQGDTAYLFVTDQNGARNGAGFPVVVGQSVAGGPPSGGGPGEGDEPGQADVPDPHISIAKISNVIRPHENKTAALDYELTEPTNVTITVHERYGTEIRTLENGYKDRGIHEVRWDGYNATGSMSASGIYMIMFRAGNQVVREKVVLIK